MAARKKEGNGRNKTGASFPAASVKFLIMANFGKGYSKIRYVKNQAHDLVS